jgi:hypothetical protein
MYNEYENVPYFEDEILKTQYNISSQRYNPFYELTLGNTYNKRLEQTYTPNYMNENKKVINFNINKILDLNNTFRKLWTDHVIWTRALIMAVSESFPDTQLITKRLFQNPKDFEIQFVKYYGIEKAKKFSNLLTEHLTIAGDLVVASKKQDINLVNQLDKNLYKNADEIAKFLNSINKYWDEKEMKKIMYDHLDLIKAEANYILKNKYQESIKIFDKIQNQALKMADMYTEGIMKQFQNEFM